MSDTARLRLLHLVLSLDETSAPYNEHCLPVADRRRISICSYFPPKLTPPGTISLYPGDGTARGFYRALAAALAADGYDAVHAHAPHFGLLLRLAPRYRRWRRRTVFTVHNSYPNFTTRNKLLLLPVFAGAARTVCCSRASADSFPWPYRRLAGGRLTSVPNGVDIARVDRVLGALPDAGSTGGDGSEPDGPDGPDGPDATNTGTNAKPCRPFRVASVGRLIGIKNPQTLLTAFARCQTPNPGAVPAGAAGDRLQLVGEGALAEPLRRQAQRLGLASQVQLRGLLPRDEVYRLLRRDADLFVSTSRGEGLPLATLEAMACGCPVVLSDIPPHREIAEGVDFIPLLDPDDADGFAAAIARVRRMSPAARRALGRRCRELAAVRFSLDAMTRAYAEVYGTLERPQPAGRVAARPR